MRHYCCNICNVLDLPLGVISTALQKPERQSYSCENTGGNLGCAHSSGARLRNTGSPKTTRWSSSPVTAIIPIMRVLVLNSRDGLGGAEYAAASLAEGLRLQDRHQVELLVGTSLSDPASQIRPKGLPGQLERGLARLEQTLGLPYLWLPWSTAALQRRLATFRPEVISLHNIHGNYLALPMLPALAASAPLVLTLHDVWPLTGHCQYPYECERWRSGCGSCPRPREYPALMLGSSGLHWRLKRSLWHTTRPTLVAPSAWLASVARHNPLAAGLPLVTIPNGIDTSLFRPREEPRLPDRSLRSVVYCLPADPHNRRRKGADLAVELLQRLCACPGPPLRLELVGARDLDLPIPTERLVVRRHGFVHDRTRLASLLADSDLLLLPSRQDNLPTIALEAAACGTPCVAFDVGGCGETVLQEQTGLLVPPFDLAAFTAAVTSLLRDHDRRLALGRAARLHILSEFSLARMAERYEACFLQARHDWLRDQGRPVP